jgi:hypothetical protein
MTMHVNIWDDDLKMDAIPGMAGSTVAPDAIGTATTTAPPMSWAPDNVVSYSQEHTANRLTAADRAAMNTRLEEVIRGYGRSYMPRPDDVTALERIAMHAIGCTAADLRDAELTEITASVHVLMELFAFRNAS